MKKTSSKIIAVVIILFVAVFCIWTVIVAGDYCMCFKSDNRAPVFAKLAEEKDGVLLYKGLGYSIKIKRTEIDAVTSRVDTIDMYLLENHIMGAVFCYASEENEYIEIENLPKDYSLEQSIKDDCIINVHNQKYYNTDEIEKFLSDLEENIESSIRIVSFTTEGDMIIKEVNFLGDNEFKITTDYTRDRFSTEEDRKIIYEKFNNFNIENGENLSAYFVSKEEKKEHVLSIYKNAEIIND